VPVEYVYLFRLRAVGVALFHHHTLRDRAGGAVRDALYKMLFSPFRTVPAPGFGLHLSTSG
jgi:hypothetical protein